MTQEDSSVVDEINNKIRDLRDSLSSRFEDEETESTLPLLDQPEGERDQSWWEENVQPLKESLEEYKRELERDDDSHRGLRAKLDDAIDLLPERNRD